MEMSAQGIALIKRFEGFSATVYLCPAGLKTIGFGHAVRENEQFPAGGISENEAETILEQDVNAVARRVELLVTTAITQNQFDALVSLAYNIGVKAFEKSTLLRFLNEGDAERACQQFLKWDLCDGKPLPGLEERRKEELKLFQSDE